MSSPIPELHDTAISTIRDPRDIRRAIQSGSLRFTENVRWAAAEKMLAALKGRGVRLPVILADATKAQQGILAWGLARSIHIQGGRTTVELEQVREVPSRPRVSCLFCQSTEDYLSPEDQRNYRIVDTPAFLDEDPNTFLLTWNPAKQITVEQFREVRQQLIEGGQPEWNWTCYATQKAMPGDRFLMLRLGAGPRGIVGCGWLRSFSEVWEEGEGPHADILWDWMVDPDQPLSPADIPGAENFHWSPQRSGVQLDAGISETVWQVWAEYCAQDQDRLGILAADTTSTQPAAAPPGPGVLEDGASSVEGRLIESWSSRRERDPANRARCLAAHGCRCAVCSMSFAEEYGEIGEGFIHVHHERPLGGSDDRTGSLHDAAGDLKPVCPNCHAMLHRGLDAGRGQVRTIQELRDLRAAAARAEGRG